jgi:hypothetical protein
MIEVALFTGVGLLGYILATKYGEKTATQGHREMFSDGVPRATPTWFPSLEPR